MADVGRVKAELGGEGLLGQAAPLPPACQVRAERRLALARGDCTCRDDLILFQRELP
ncbi:MAG: hypothetical protein JO345_33275 [Streptosporangiaceae bacterium]|nr:hypothetical protein [Streptosporangiaceae bacterium]